jgi:sec-independent protein translocase protein TatA
MPGFIGFPELLLLGLVALLVFGPKRLPEMGRSLGHGMREFKDSVTGDGHRKDEAELRALNAGDPTSTPTTAREPERIAS